MKYNNLIKIRSVIFGLLHSKTRLNVFSRVTTLTITGLFYDILIIILQFHKIIYHKLNNVIILFYGIIIVQFQINSRHINWYVCNVNKL